VIVAGKTTVCLALVVCLASGDKSYDCRDDSSVLGGGTRQKVRLKRLWKIIRRSVRRPDAGGGSVRAVHSSVQVVRGGLRLVGAARGRDAAAGEVGRTAARAGGVPWLLNPVVVLVSLLVPLLALFSTKMTVND